MDGGCETMISFEGVFYPVLVMGTLGLAFGALLAFASIKFFVAVDPRVGLIREILPGANCGGCGYPGCDGYADGIVNEGGTCFRLHLNYFNLLSKYVCLTTTDRKSVV